MAPKGVEICLSTLRAIPVIFITAIIIWSYYAYVVQMCIFEVNNIPQKVLYILVYHVLFVLFAWTFWKTIFTPTGVPHPEYYLSDEYLVQLGAPENFGQKKTIINEAAKYLPVYCRTMTGDIRYCAVCKSIKPDRTHHCSVCGKCVLKMDHHCPWVSNCVGYSNYKFFVLFLFYGFLYTLFVALTSIQYFIIFWSDISHKFDMSGLHIVFLFFAAVMFSISLVSLLGYHLYLLFNNRTTLEGLQGPIFTSGPDKKGFDLGWRANFIEVFGSDRLLWFIPIFTSLGNGCTFPLRRGGVPVLNSYQAMDSTMTVVNVQNSSSATNFEGGVVTEMFDEGRSKLICDDNEEEEEKLWTNGSSR